MKTAVKKDPAKWKRIVSEVKASSKGGDPGEWSARKAQLAVQKYKKSGGSYSGPKSETSLSKWTKEKWRTSQNLENSMSCPELLSYCSFPGLCL